MHNLSHLIRKEAANLSGSDLVRVDFSFLIVIDHSVTLHKILI